MIYDTLNNLPNYLGVSDNLDTVIEYIMARDITTLPAGRTRIDGDKAVVTVSTVTPQTSDKALFQRHDNHITLETDLDGSELFEVSLAELTPTSTSEPLTAPPPRTRSSSPMPVENRISASASSSVTGRALRTLPPPAGREAPFPAARAAWGCSTMVFHAPQAGHFPAHLGVSLPHSVQ